MSVKDHLGNEYATKSDMCSAWGVGLHTFRTRTRRLGLTLEQALTGRWDRKRDNGCADHTGRRYGSEDAMCAAWGIDKATYKSRIYRGWSTGRALTEPVAAAATRNPKARPATDHEGTVFESESAMCRKWGVRPDTFRYRISHGRSLAEALGQYAGTEEPGSVADHAGKKYNSMAGMCAAYGKSQSTVSKRLANGMTLEQALTKPSRKQRQAGKKSKSISDPFGGTYWDYAGLCKAMRLPPVYGHARTMGTPGLVAASCSRYWAGKSCGKYADLRPVEFPWFLARDGASEIIIHYRDIIAEYDAAKGE